MRLTLLLAGSLSLSAILLGLAPPAQAQTVDRRHAALEAFETGEAAAQEERWADAITAFQEAYELSGVPTALFNVAYALRALGRYVEARRAFDELFTLRVPEEIRAEAEGYRDEVVARIAHLRLNQLEEGVEYELRLDGQIVDDELVRPAVVDCDPGSHRVEVRRAGYVAFEWSGTVGEGQTRELEVELAAMASSGGNVAEEPWFWIVIGVVVVGGAVAAGFIADDQAQLRPVVGRTVINL
jgi:tetratricopeptide (TPR) repeat protein